MEPVKRGYFRLRILEFLQNPMIPSQVLRSINLSENNGMGKLASSTFWSILRELKTKELIKRFSKGRGLVQTTQKGEKFLEEELRVEAIPF